MSEERRGDWRPIPDPTVLTTEALLREVAHLKELLEQKVADNRQLYEQRFQMQEQYRQEQKADAKEALNAALVSTQTQIGAALDAIADLKERVGKFENRALGSVEARTERRFSTETSLAYAMAIIAGLGLLASLGGFIFYVAVHH